MSDDLYAFFQKALAAIGGVVATIASTLGLYKLIANRKQRRLEEKKLETDGAKSAIDLARAASEYARDSSVHISQTRHRILVAEDDESDITLWRRAMRTEPIDLDVARNGEDAVECYRQIIEDGDEYALIFLDYQLPKMSGIEVFEELRRRGADVSRIVLLTGSVESHVMTEALEARIKTVHLKSLDADAGQLRGMVRSMLKG